MTQHFMVARYQPTKKALLLSFFLLAFTALLGCKPDGASGKTGKTDEKDMVGVSITGLDHLPEHLSIQNFWIDGYGADQAGKGGSQVCCAMLPREWHEGLTVKVKWGVTNWRDGTYYWRNEVVPVDKYPKPGHLWVHFFPDGSVRVVASAMDAPESPDYPGPHIPPTQKEPWNQYPDDGTLAKEISPHPAGSPP